MIRLIPFILSAILLGAHFLRDGSMAVALICALFPLILLWRDSRALLASQIYLGLAVLIWLTSTASMVLMRMAYDMTWSRLVIIMGAVIAFNVWALLLLRSTRITARWAIVERPHEQ